MGPKLCRRFDRIYMINLNTRQFCVFINDPYYFGFDIVIKWRPSFYNLFKINQDKEADSKK